MKALVPFWCPRDAGPASQRQITGWRSCSMSMAHPGTARLPWELFQCSTTDPCPLKQKASKCAQKSVRIAHSLKKPVSISPSSNTESINKASTIEGVTVILNLGSVSLSVLINYSCLQWLTVCVLTNVCAAVHNRTKKLHHFIRDTIVKHYNTFSVFSMSPLVSGITPKNI